MKIIALVNQKGGVAKTTTAIALSSGLTRQGKRVLMIDLDAQCSMTNSVLQEEEEDNKYATVHDLLVAKHEGQVKIRENIMKTRFGDLLQGDKALISADRDFPIINGVEYKLKEAINKESLESDYDFIIIDTPPHMGYCMKVCLATADTCIVPTEATKYSIEGIAELDENLRDIKKYYNPNLRYEGILITRCSPRTTLTKEYQETLREYAERMGTKVYKTPIRECVALKEAVTVRTPIYDWAPSSNGNYDYKQLVEAVLDDNEE